MLSLLRSRRSIRTFHHEPIPELLIEKLQEAVLRAPSSRSLNPWEFVFVQNQAVLTKLSTCKPHGAGFLQKAPLAVVVCADPGKCDVWIEDASIASLILHLTSHSLGLGSCWVQVRKRMYDDTITSSEYTKTCLNLPDNLEVISIIAIGYPAETKNGHPKSELLYPRIRNV